MQKIVFLLVSCLMISPIHPNDQAYHTIYSHGIVEHSEKKTKRFSPSFQNTIAVHFLDTNSETGYDINRLIKESMDF